MTEWITLHEQIANIKAKDGPWDVVIGTLEDAARIGRVVLTNFTRLQIQAFAANQTPNPSVERRAVDVVGSWHQMCLKLIRLSYDKLKSADAKGLDKTLGQRLHDSVKEIDRLMVGSHFVGVVYPDLLPFADDVGQDPALSRTS